MGMSARTYRGYTLSEAQEELAVWKAAKRAAATGQSYAIEGRSLTRQNLSEINAQIDFFAEVADALTSGRSGPIFVTARVRR